MIGNGIRKFYQLVDVAQEANGFVVRLDGKPVKTTQRHIMTLPGAELANAIAEEWRRQGDTLDPATMPLTRLAFAAIDTVSGHRARVESDITAYGRTDLLCYRADTPSALAERQAQAWDPLLDWAAEHFGARLAIGSGIQFVSQPDASLKALDEAVGKQSDFALAALHGAVAITGSMILALALAEGRLPAKDAFALSRLDEAFQNEAWGVDAEAAARNARHEAELRAIEQFLRLTRP